MSFSCPSCGGADTGVYDGRPTADQKAFLRRRKCDDCGHKFKTYEIHADILVILENIREILGVFKRKQKEIADVEMPEIPISLEMPSKKEAGK